MIIVFLAVLGLCVLFLFYMIFEAHQNIVLKKTIQYPDLPKLFQGYTLYFISDIHRRKISPKMLECVGKTDIVIIGGDLTESGVPFSRVDENLRLLKNFGVPLIFVWGNHDIHVDREKLINLFNKYQVIQLVNESIPIQKRNEILNIIGVDDATNFRDDLEKAISTTKTGFRLLVSHNPIIVKKIKQHHQIGLVISGHTHGGQIRPLGWGIREKGGIKAMSFGKLVISSGYGTTRLHLRLGAKPDTLLLRLESGEN